MSTDLKIYVNKTLNTGTGQDYQTVPGNYIEVDLLNDRLIWSAGNVDVADGLVSPSEAELNEASTIISNVAVEVDKCFLDDASTGLIEEIFGVGSNNNRYVFGFSFNGATASEPTLEAWDDINHNTVLLHVLGNNTPANSMVRAICTTDANPGAGWIGYPLSGSSYKILLNNGNGALGILPTGETSQELYANIKIVIPASYAEPKVENFVLTVRYSWN